MPDRSYEVLDRWIDGDGDLDATDALGGLLAAAQRSHVELSNAEARVSLEAVLSEARQRGRSRWGRPGARWLAGIAALLAIGAALSALPPAPAPAPSIVKEIFYEGVHDGEVVHLDMTLYRNHGKEPSYDPKL
jgi:hypothetical protein